MKKMLLLLSSVVLFESCFSSVGSGALMGSSMGGMFGGAMGGLVRGPHGRDMGTVIGIIAGAATGAAVASAAENKRYDDYVNEYNSSSSRSYSNARRVTSSGSSNTSMSGSTNSSNNSTGSVASSAATTQTSPLVLRNLRFIDDGGNQVLNREEGGKIIFELANPTKTDYYDVVPYVYEINGNEHVTLSPSTRIEVVKASDVVRYTCSLRTDKKLAAGTLNFRISVAYGDNDFITLRDFSLPSAK